MIQDKALESNKHDRLGFSSISKTLARSFLENDLSKGFVVGVEGSWGSGKSSLVKMALDEISKTERGPKIVEFSPWLVGSRDDLISQLFSDIEPVLSEVLPLGEKENTRELFKKYADAASGLAMLADLAASSGVTPSKPIAKFFHHVAGKFRKGSEASIGQLNKELRKKLCLLDRPIIVFIDDLDRLEPNEISEILRLVKAVADFPNVAYILAYDSEVVSQSLQKSLGVPSGRTYLEKIVQTSFKVPQAMSFDLRNWLTEEFSELIEGQIHSDEALVRLEAACRQWCAEYLRTPRDIVRVVNSLKLNFVPVRENVDPADMLFLQVIKTKSPDLFNWIEEYIVTFAAADGIISASTQKQEGMGERLLELVSGDDESRRDTVHRMMEHLPGFDPRSLHQKEEKFRVLVQPHEAELGNLDMGKRLASSHHFSYYFSLAKPAGSLDDLEVSAFLSLLAENASLADARFRSFLEVNRPQGGNMAQVLIERMVNSEFEITSGQIKTLFEILGAQIDNLANIRKSISGHPDIYRAKRGEAFGLIARVNDSVERKEIISKLFSEADSISWLAGIIREIGLFYGENSMQRRPEQGPILSRKEYNLAADIYTTRLAAMEPSKLLDAPEFLNAMYAWHELDHVGAVSTWVEEQTRSDRGLLEVLERMGSWSHSSDTGVQYRVREETIERFFGGDSVVIERVKRMLEGKEADDDLIRRAADIITSID